VEDVQAQDQLRLDVAVLELDVGDAPEVPPAALVGLEQLGEVAGAAPHVLAGGDPGSLMAKSREVRIATTFSTRSSCCCSHRTSSRWPTRPSSFSFRAAPARARSPSKTRVRAACVMRMRDWLV
jgi:hypothetical protein